MIVAIFLADRLYYAEQHIAGHDRGILCNEGFISTNQAKGLLN